MQLNSNDAIPARRLTLARRAIDDGPAVQALLGTRRLERGPDGIGVLEAASRVGIPQHRVSDGVMGTLTATRPLPAAMAIVRARLAPAERLPMTPASVVMVAEKADNPANLGMIIRTADAMGAEAVVVGGGAPLDPKCIRAPRGAVRRLPLHVSATLPSWLHRRRGDRLAVLGATPGGSASAYRCPLDPPVAVLVGNAHDGLSPAALAACAQRVRIPMAPGQDSLNVGVAAGMPLYEVVRRRQAAGCGRRALPLLCPPQFVAARLDIAPEDPEVVRETRQRRLHLGRKRLQPLERDLLAVRAVPPEVPKAAELVQNLDGGAVHYPWAEDGQIGRRTRPPGAGSSPHRRAGSPPPRPAHGRAWRQDAAGRADAPYRRWRRPKRCPPPLRAA